LLPRATRQLMRSKDNSDMMALGKPSPERGLALLEHPLQRARVSERCLPRGLGAAPCAMQLAEYRSPGCFLFLWRIGRSF